MPTALFYNERQSIVVICLKVGHRNQMQDILRDLKSYTSQNLKKAIQEIPFESRKEWILWLLEKAGGKNNNNNKYQLRQQHNHP